MLLSPFFSRLFLLLAILSAEVVSFTVWLDAATLPRTYTLVRLLAYTGPRALNFAIAFLCFAAFLLPPRLLPHQSEFDTLARRPIRWPLLGLHAACLAVLALLSHSLFANLAPTWNGDLLIVLWITSGIASTLALAVALLPGILWRQLGNLGAAAWVFALLGATCTIALASVSVLLWRPTARLTFTLVSALLHPFVPGLSADPAALALSTPNFAIEIADSCSGLQGAGLMLVFGTAWLLAFRREYRFPAALLLLPLGILAISILNVLRIAALFLIGYYGAPSIALGGFHSQAGWIAFTVAALLFAHLSRRLAIFSTHPAPSAATASHNPVAPFLIPFLAILAAAQLSSAVSAGFDYLYPLRLVAAVAALWYFRVDYLRLPWRIHWPLALGAGATVLVLWLALERLIPQSAPQLPPPLAWTVLRILGATLTVPIAEELAFRGYLIRRLASADFESVSLGAFHFWPFLLSSAAFGLLHGQRAIAATVAGMIYALVQRRHASLGDAVAAHAITNALLAAWVLYTGQYQLW